MSPNTIHRRRRPRRRAGARRGKGRGGAGWLLLAAAAVLLWAGTGLPPPSTADAPQGGSVVAPVAGGRVSSSYGPRRHPVTGQARTHHGIDIAAPQGTPIRAIADAAVIEAGPASGYGLWLRLRHHDGTVSIYGHVHTITTPAATTVTAGQQIATVGARGQATGPHLHLEIWPDGQRQQRVDPARWFARHNTPLTARG